MMMKTLLYLTLAFSLTGCAALLENPVAQKSESYDYETNATQDYVDCVRRKKKKKAKVDDPPCQLD